MHTDTLVNSLGAINETLTRLEKKSNQNFSTLITTTSDTANRVQKAISEG